ncbi:diguanylate cyclase [Candidatus Woesearchaeota archaeon]|nr:diguanylate cyclase [Candidatus Woesearchaeota archaeon]
MSFREKQERQEYALRMLSGQLNFERRKEVEKDERINELEAYVTELEPKVGINPISKIANIRGYEETLEKLIDTYNVVDTEEKRRSTDKTQESKTFAVVAADIVKLKHINDTYGRTAGGDTAIRQVAETAKEKLRANDSAFSPSGDEFYFIIDNIPTGEQGRAQADKIVRDRIKKWLDNNPLKLERITEDRKGEIDDVKVQIHHGIAIYEPTMTAEQITALADAELDKAQDEAQNPYS